MTDASRTTDASRITHASRMTNAAHVPDEPRLPGESHLANTSRAPRADQARKRAIRDYARAAGAPYSVAARRFDEAGIRSGETFASQGRTTYPTDGDAHRRALAEERALRPFTERVRDTRRAGVLPAGRAAHLVDRFPPGRGAPGTGVGPLYAGAARADLLATMYVVAGYERSDLVPPAGDLAWIAETGEETAIDTACAALDRATRRALDGGSRIPGRITAALDASRVDGDVHVRGEAIRLGAICGALGWEELPFLGVRQILDAVLVVADDGHAPGTRVRLLAPPHRDRLGTIVGVLWGPTGPPVGYEVRRDGAGSRRGGVAMTERADPDDLVVLAGQDVAPMAAGDAG